LHLLWYRTRSPVRLSPHHHKPASLRGMSWLRHSALASSVYVQRDFQGPHIWDHRRNRLISSSGRIPLLCLQQISERDNDVFKTEMQQHQNDIGSTGQKKANRGRSFYQSECPICMQSRREFFFQKREKASSQEGDSNSRYQITPQACSESGVITATLSRRRSWVRWLEGTFHSIITACSS
jgi:hypothetical protein